MICTDKDILLVYNFDYYIRIFDKKKVRYIVISPFCPSVRSFALASSTLGKMQSCLDYNNGLRIRIWPCIQAQVFLKAVLKLITQTTLSFFDGGCSYFVQ